MVKTKREKKRYVHELLIMAFVLALIGLTVSYATVNATLDIAGISATRIANWSIVFDSAEVFSKKGTAELVKGPEIKGSNIHYEVKLKNPGDSVTIKAVVKNKGTLNAKLSSFDVFGIPSQYEDYISYKVTDENNDFLYKGLFLSGEQSENDPKRYMTVLITISYDNLIIDEKQDSKVFNLGLGLNFAQA